jgi:hypothetical protein
MPYFSEEDIEKTLKYIEEHSELIPRYVFITKNKGKQFVNEKFTILDKMTNEEIVSTDSIKLIKKEFQKYKEIKVLFNKKTGLYTEPIP